MLLGAAGCGGGPKAAPPDLPAVGGQVSLLRFPAAGGPVVAYHPDSLADPTWTSLSPAAPVPRIRRIIGADLEERMLWAVDSSGALISVDLESRAVRKQATPPVAVGGMGPDGSLYLADAGNRVLHVLRRSPVPFHDPLPARPRALFGTLNDQLVAVTDGAEPQLVTAGADQELGSLRIPPGPVAATFWGDLVAVATDTAVVLYETQGKRTVTSIPFRQGARHVAFSPSGHRLYVAGTGRDIAVFDRFSGGELARIPLEGAPREIRVDASGRWLLARPAEADSLWIVDLATDRFVGAVPGDWGPDLPLVAGAATLVVRQADDLETWDLRKLPAQRVTSLKGAGEDFWLAAAWVPRERLSAAVAAAESATVAQDSALAADSAVAVTDSSVIYLQVSSSQNPTWAEALARSLTEGGFPARVLEPKQADDGYRVVVGPYGSREPAEEAGRRLGRAYFLLRLPAKLP